MRVICHIGHHKTGTTSLQAFLSQNFANLLESGVLYPWVESEGAALALRSFTKSSESRDALLPINFREAHNALAFRMLAEASPNWKVPPYHKALPHSRQMLLAIHNQIKTLNPTTLVLCSEVMSQFGKVAPDQIPRLRAEALTQANEFLLWCTLRRPDDQLVSWHGQQVRFGQSPPPLSDPDKGLKLDNLHVDYRGVIEPWLQQIDNAIPVLRPYKDTLAQGGSVNDFLQNSGMSAIPRLTPAPSLNISRKPAVVILLRMANASLPHRTALELGAWLDSKTDRMTLASSSEVEFFGPAARARLFKRFRPIHTWLSEVSGRTEFFTDLDEITQCKPISETEALHQLLDQLSPGLIDQIESSEIRNFLLRQRHAA